jgi:hypothetical protein
MKTNTTLRLFFWGLCFFFVLCSSAKSQNLDSKLDALSRENFEWISQSCPKSLGPSLWRNCVERELGALSLGPPNIADLHESFRQWILQSCPKSMGPSLTINCMNRESAAVRSGIPSLEKLSSQNKAWVQSSCPTSLGPSLYKSCTEREMRALY